jgi:uncharacterized membrane protein
MSIWVALILISLCALLWDVGIVLQKSAVDRLPRIRFGRGLAPGLLALLKSGSWMAGLAASAAGWGLFAYALSFTPVSVARAIQGSGFVILALFSLAFLKHRLTAREWIGVALVTAGIAALGIAEGAPGRPAGGLSPGRLAAAFAACLLACAAVSAASGLLRKLPRVRSHQIRLPHVITFSFIAGTLLGLGDVSTKILLDVLQTSGLGLPVAAAGAGLILFYVSGFFVLSRAYQHGRAILVTAVSDLCSRLVAIFIGIAALGEALAGDGRSRTAAVLGYAAIIVGAVLLARFSGEDIAEKLAGTGSKALRQPQEGERSAPAQVDADD